MTPVPIRGLLSWTLATLILGAWLGAGTAVAQPLVTGNLTIYYDFDDIVGGQFLDESGNGFHGAIHDDGPGQLTLDTLDAPRGAGAARLQQPSNPADPAVFIDLDGAHITNNFPERLPGSGLNDEFGITIAAWLNVTAMSGDQSVLHARSSDGVFSVFFQLQDDGRLRMSFRDPTNGITVSQILFTDGSADNAAAAYPVDQWFHYAGTYDMTANRWAMYFNGAEIAAGSGSGLDLANWGGIAQDFFAAGIGMVSDTSGRRFDGALDEFYVFNRALSAAEIETLFSPEPECGDSDGDGVCEDGDGSGLAGDLPCDSGQTLECDDNCPAWPNAGQTDRDDSGIGDDCECGDQSGDGFVTITDILAINEVIFEVIGASPLCDTNEDGQCNVADILGVNAKIFGAPAYCTRYPSPVP